MNLHLGAEAPWLARAAVDSLLIVHIGGGSVGIASGWVSILAKKGGRLHRVAGNVFFAAMLCMTVVAAGTAPFLEDAWTNTTAAVFTFYLIVSSWAVVKRRPMQVGRVEAVAIAIPLGVVVLGLALASGAVRPGEAGVGVVYPFALICALAAVCDLRMLKAGGVAGPARVARHLWRMTAALFVATGSFFLGQQKFLPEQVQGTMIPALPVFGVLALLVFWMFKVRGPRLRRLRPAAA